MKAHHICVCICTFKRPELLRELLTKLEVQYTADLYTYSVVVADNDVSRSAEPVVTTFSSASNLPVKYCVEPQQNIALVRNRALQYADGDLIAFIDDDEFPEDQWLFELLRSLEHYQVDGVLGPVKPFFRCEPPAWIKRGKFFDRKEHATGYNVPWFEARTGNVLFRSRILQNIDPPFRSQFDTAGEDVDFFRRAMEQGHKFVWCSEGAVFEEVPAWRCTSRYLLRRALLRGSNFSKHPRHRVRNAARSIIAVPSYIIALPILAIFGKHILIKYLIKLCDHSSRLLAYLGLPLVTQRET